MCQGYKVRSYHIVESSPYLDVRLWNHYHGNVCFRGAKLSVTWLDTFGPQFKQLVFNWTYLSI
jgi:hypothetical protein